MKSYEMITPNVVVLVTVCDNGVFVSAPFSWVSPVSKEGHVAVFMRSTSNTLRILNCGCNKIVLSTVKDDCDVAQRILLSRRVLEANLDADSIEIEGLSCFVPDVVNASANAEVERIVNLGIGKIPYSMVVLKLCDPVVISKEKNLLFCKEKKFSRSVDFEVDGY